jgi:CRISPR/Cas system CSM-associated protein Csm3 (group 7 of RAMP superfamily)
MSRVRYEFAGTLVALAPLHVGSGEFRHVGSVKGKAAADEAPEVAEIVRDARGCPYIPGTAIKGLLRRLAEEFADADFGAVRDELFGVIKNAADDRGNSGKLGQMGVLLCRGAETIGTPPDIRGAPFADRKLHGNDAAKLGPGVFVAARTRIEPASGTAQDSTLFFQEMAAPHTRFALRCLLDLRGADAAARGARLAAALIRILDRLTADDGRAVGKGQADGFGRLRLDSDVTIRCRSLDGSGNFEPTDVSALWQSREIGVADPTGGEVLNLICDGPFIVIDGSRKPEPAAREADGATPQVAAQRLGATMPLVLGSSISGALRSRARWLASLDGHRRGDPAPVDGDRIVSRLAEIDSLTPVQRLFGVAGFRGLLEIDAVAVREAELWQITSVKLDRFSGAPIDNALFTTEAFIGVRLTVRLRLAGRRDAVPQEADRTLFNALLCDIRRNGLQLGHGGNKGFGWFAVEGASNG